MLFDSHSTLSNSGAPAAGLIGVDSFERTEEKFLVPLALEEEIKKNILMHLRPAYPDSQSKFTLIESIYFDSDRFDFFQDHFSSLDKRYKLRLRRYATNGIFGKGPVFLEAKSKTRRGLKNISAKKRFGLDGKNFEELLRAKTICFTSELRAANPKLALR